MEIVYIKYYYLSILFWHCSLGISVILFTIPTILVILYNLKEQKKIKNKKGILWSIPIILLSLTYFIFNNKFFQFLNIPVIFTLLILMCTEITGEKITENRFIRKCISKAFESEKISDTITRIILIIVSFVYILGFITTFIKNDNIEKEEETRNINLSTLTTNMILISLNVIYLIFSMIQFRYLFINAGKTPNFDYATYARTGFFQLMFVSFINLALLKTTKQIKEKVIQILKILLIIFTIIIVISAIFRMHLYEQEYGYTYLRLFVYFILATEILILIPILMSVCNQKIDTFNISIKIIIYMYIILNFINIDYIIARNNIDKYLNDPENNTIDSYYIVHYTGIDAIDAKLKLLNASTDELSNERKEYMNNVKTTIKNNINGYKICYVDNSKNKWQEWNLSKTKVYQLLKNM